MASACGSCAVAPARHAPARVTMAIPDPDRQLLSNLGLDPLATTDGDPLPAPRRATVAPPFALAGATDGDAARASDCLTAAVYYEARSEPIDGQRAVAQVVLNRVRDPAFPASICRVVYQRSSRGCQFTFACDGSTDRPLEPRAWAIARAVADAALGGSVFAPVGAATHYHAASILPWWAPSLARIGAIGSHIFYRWSDRLSGALAFRQAYAGHEAMPAAPAWTDVAASGADPAATLDAGVLVHRGGGGSGVAVHRSAGPDASFGVTVHRGDAGEPSPDAADAPVTAG